MGEKLTKQELHNLAMNIVGEYLEKEGYEFLSINSKLKRDPQFVALKNETVCFIIVRAVSFPEDANAYDPFLMRSIKEHALKFEAKTFYAGVGLGHGSDYGKPVLKDEAYTMVFRGVQEIL